MQIIYIGQRKRGKMKIALHPHIFEKLGEAKRPLPKFRKLCKSSLGGSDYDFAIDWHYSKEHFTCRRAWLESGFFYGTAYIDMNGLFNTGSFTLKENNKIWRNYEAKESAKSLMSKIPILNIGMLRAKVEQEWSGVVLPLQVFYDKMIMLVGSNERYIEFVEGACKYYGKDLFLKVHPCSSLNKHKKLWAYMYEIAEKYGCGIGNVTHRIFETCEFVISYTGMTSMDCMLMGVPVVQFAPGPFSNTGTIEDSNREYVSKCNANIELGHKLCDFLVWKYYFSNLLSDEHLCELITTFAESKERFPLPEKFSFAETWHYNQKKKEVR